MLIAATVAPDSTLLVGLGRAPRVLLADVDGSTVTSQRVLDVHWDVLHGDHECNHDDPDHSHGAGGHGSHHARIVTFLREHEVDVVLAAHAGPPMVNTIMKLGLVFLSGQGDATELLVPAAKAATEAIEEARAQQA